MAGSKRLRNLTGAVLLLVASGSAPLAARVGKVDTSTDWITLFDGSNLKGWRTYGEAALRPQWQIVDGALTLTAPGGGAVTFGNVVGDFELRLEWKIAAGGNSGVFYLVDPSDESVAPWQSGLEMQILDNAAHQDRHNPLTRAGSMYALYPARREVARAPGRWNDVRIVVRGRRVEHWLNGVQVVLADLDSPEFVARVRASKFAPYAATYGRAKHGLVLLQDHQDRVQFRKIRLRHIKAATQSTGG